MKKQSLESLSNENLKKRMLLANLLALVIGIAAISVTILYFLQKENDYDLLIVGAGLGVALTSYQARVANGIKKEIKRRETS